jgi:hypothetical protein
LPEGRERESQIRRSVLMMLRTNPEQAAKLAELTEPRRRDQVVEMVFQQWLKKDPLKAGAGLKKSYLPDERKRFLQPQTDKE